MTRPFWLVLLGVSIACSPTPLPIVTGPFIFKPTCADWRKRLDTPPAGRFGVIGGLLMTGTGNGQVLALDAQTGKIRWRRKDRNRIETTWTVCDSLLYIVTRSGFHPITAVDLHTGRARFRIRVGSIEGEPAVLGDLLVLFLIRGEIVCITGTNGKILWKTRIPGNLRGSPAVGDRRVFGVTDGGRLFCLTDHGEIRWSRELGERFVAGPVWAGGRIYGGSLTGTLFALDGETGGLLWSREVGGRIHIPPAADADRVFVVTGRGRLWALDTRDGSPLWDVDLGSPGTGFLLDQKGLYVGTQAERLYRVEAETGRIRHAWTVKGRIKTPPAIWENRLFVGTDQGWIYGFCISE